LLVSPHLSKQAWFTVKVGMMLAAELITCAADRFMPYSTDEGLIANSADIMAICWKRSCTASRLHGQALRCEKSKEKFALFSDHNGSLLRRQPGAP